MNCSLLLTLGENLATCISQVMDYVYSPGKWLCNSLVTGSCTFHNDYESNGDHFEYG